MPDLVSHAASGFIFRNFFPDWPSCKKAFPLALLGVLLPDLLARPAVFLGPGFYYTFQYFHTPFACLLQAFIISCFFVSGQRVLVFRAVTLGWVLHQGFDLFQDSISPGYYYLFWPFYNQPMSLGLFWAGYWPWVTVATVLAALFTRKRFIAQARSRMLAENGSDFLKDRETKS